MPNGFISSFLQDPTSTLDDLLVASKNEEQHRLDLLDLLDYG